jgi:heme/copper-type cytochrome/quinol oxidase subunit 3
MSQRAVPDHAIVEPAKPGFMATGMPSLVTRSPEWAPEVDARLARVGTWIWIGADVLFFVAWFFAYFYLRDLNNDNDWMGPGIIPPHRGIGAAIVLLAVMSAALYWVGASTVITRGRAKRTLLWLALVAGILCFVVQIYEFRNLGFDPQLGGGYPSVFVGLKGAWLIQLAGAMIWMTSHIAQARPGKDVTVRPESALTFGYFLAFLAGICLISYLVLYFV